MTVQSVAALQSRVPAFLADVLRRRDRNHFRFARCHESLPKW